MADNGSGPTEWRQITGWVLMTDGTAHHVKTTVADRIGYGHAARRNGWPALGKDVDVELWQAFLFYHALFRTGRYDGPWEQFVAECEVTQPDEEGEPVNPTPPIPSSG